MIYRRKRNPQLINVQENLMANEEEGGTSNGWDGLL